MPVLLTRRVKDSPVPGLFFDSNTFRTDGLPFVMSQAYSAPLPVFSKRLPAGRRACPSPRGSPRATAFPAVPSRHTCNAGSHCKPIPDAEAVAKSPAPRRHLRRGAARMQTNPKDPGVPPIAFAPSVLWMPISSIQSRFTPRLVPSAGPCPTPRRVARHQPFASPQKAQGATSPLPPGSNRKTAP